mgnify:CR=1 FL=1
MSPAVPSAPAAGLLADRIRRAGEVAADQGVDLLAVTPGTDLRYLIDCSADTHERLLCLLIPASGHRAPPALVVPRLEAARLNTPLLEELGVEVVTWSDGEDPHLLVSDLAGGPQVLGVSDAMTAPGSSFSLTSDALNATVQLDYTTPNFLFDLGSDNITVGALSLGSGTGTLVAGNMVYDATMLNDLAGGSFFTGTGTITVVPEPGTLALGAVGLLVTVSLLRHRRRNA